MFKENSDRSLKASDCRTLSVLFFLKKKAWVPERTVTQNSIGDGDVVIPRTGKKIPERRSGLRPSEEEPPQRRSGAFHHKTTPGRYNVYNCSFGLYASSKL
jgi:hypothetical protein